MGLHIQMANLKVEGSISGCSSLPNIVGQDTNPKLFSDASIRV